MKGYINSINAKRNTVSKKGNNKTNQESEAYPFLHIKSKIKVQNKI